MGTVEIIFVAVVAVLFIVYAYYKIKGNQKKNK